MGVQARLSGVDPGETNWQRVDHLLATVAELSRSKLPAEEFWPKLLTPLRETLSAIAARSWTIDGDRHIALTKEVRCETAILDGAGERLNRTTLVEEVLGTGRAAMTRGAVNSNGPSPNASDWDVLASPVQIDGRCVGVLEVVRPTSHRPSEPDWSLDVLTSVAELCADYQRERRLEWLDERHLLWKELGDLALRLHQSLDLSETAYTIANDGRSFVGCDRMSVVATQGGRGRVLAISGAANCDPRSDAVRGLEKLVTAVVARGAALEFEGSADGLPPQLRQPLQRYADASALSALAIIPLTIANAPAGARAARQPVGALVVEQFTGRLDPRLRERLELVARHCAAALGNAAVVRRIPLSSLFRGRPWQQSVGRITLPRIVLVLLIAAGLAGAMIQADFEIESRGELQPRLRREIFAPDDAVVEELKVDHGVQVAAGDVLVLLRNPRLDLEFQRVGGELQTARKRLSAVQAARIENTGDSTSRATGASRLSGEEAGLEESIRSLEQQHRLLEEQQAEMTVRSPISGQVLTWDLPQLLQSRPVQRGQTLMTVADPLGPWTLELHVPDRRIGHMLDAQSSLEERLPVKYVLATDPGREHHAQIDRIAQSVEPGDADDPNVEVTVRVDRSDLTQPRPGAGVTAKIWCGRRPLGYVWLHDLIDAVRAWIAF